MSQLLSARPGITNSFHWNNDGTYTVNVTQDVEPILEANKRAQIENGKRTDRDFVPVASIPIVVQYEWVKRYGIRDVFDEEYWPLIRRLLNDPEWRHLRRSELVV